MENNYCDTDSSAEVAAILQPLLHEDEKIIHTAELSVHSPEHTDVLTPPAAIESQWAEDKKNIPPKAVHLIPRGSVMRNANHKLNFNKKYVVSSGTTAEKVSESNLTLDSRTVGAERNLNALIDHSVTNESANNCSEIINKSLSRSAVVREIPKNQLAGERTRRVIRPVHASNRFVRTQSSFHVTEKSLLPFSVPTLTERKLTTASSSSQAVGRISSNKITRGQPLETDLIKLTKPKRDSHRFVRSLNDTKNVGDTKRVAVKKPFTEKTKKFSEYLIGNGPKAYEDKWCVSNIKNKTNSDETPKSTSFSLGVVGNHPHRRLQKSWTPHGIVLNCLDTFPFKSMQWHMGKQLSAKENIWAPLPAYLQKNEHQLWKTTEFGDLKTQTECNSTETDKLEAFQSFSSLCDEEEPDSQQNGPIINNLAGALQEGLAQYMATNTTYRAPSLESLASLDRFSCSSEEESEFSDSSDAEDSSDSWDSGYYKGYSYRKDENESSSDADIDTDTDSDDDSLSDDLQKLGFRDLDNRIRQMAIIWGYCCDHFGTTPEKPYEEELADPELPGECLLHNILAVRRVSGLSRRP